MKLVVFCAAVILALTEKDLTFLELGLLCSLCFKI